MTKMFLIAGTLFVLLTASAHAQKKTEPAAASNSDSVFSSESRVVLVDSVVTDRKGVYIGDLTSKQFRVREDGKEQTLTSFSNLADEAPDAQKHYVVLFFDNPSMPQTDQHYARNAAVEFIGTNAGPGHQMAIVEFGSALRVTQNLTDDVDRLKQAVSGVKLSGAGTGAVAGILATRSGNPAAGALPEALRNLAKGLARVPGRKTIILLSEGLSVNHDLLKGAIQECNRSNVAIYPVDIRALGAKSQAAGLGIAELGRSGPGMQPGMQNGVNTDLSVQSPSDALYTLAQDTGGFVVSGPGKLPDDLDRIGKEQSRYYILGYSPANESQPNACHALKVEVDRSGARVRARNSYCDVTTPEIQTGTSTERDLEARLSANATPNVQATMQTPFFYIAPNIARVDLALDIPGAGVKFVKEKGKFLAVLNVIGIAYLPDGGVAARFNDTAKVTLDDQAQVEDFATRPWHFEKQFEMASGTFDLKLAFSSNGGSFGKVETQLTIDPWDPSKFLLSGLALSQSTHPAVATGLGGEVDLFGDKVPLTSNGVQYIPAGTNRLQKSQKAFLYGELYEPALAAPDRKGDPGAGAQLTVLNAKTGEIVKQLGFVKPDAVPGASAIPLGMTLPTDELAPGSYIAQVAAQDIAGNRSARRIDFELVP